MKIRIIAKWIYHRLPFTQEFKWRLRESLYKYFIALEKSNSIVETAVNVAGAIKESPRADRDTKKELALQIVLGLLADHAKKFGQITHWLALPFLATGGAEKVALNISKALLELYPNQSIALIVTDRDVVDENINLPEGVLLIILDDYFKNESSYARKQSFLRDLILCARPTCFHNINSEVAWHLILSEGAVLNKIVKLYASIFAFQFSGDGKRKVGYAANFLEKGMPNLHGLFSDNRRFITDAVLEYDFDESLRQRMHVLYQPCPEIKEHSSEKIISNCQENKRPLILWAGRLDAEKRIDLFFDVVRRCKFADFKVFGQVVLDENQEFPTLPNLTYEGPFSSPQEWIKDFHFDGFIFTSRWEGMPNVILEAGALGIPIIAPTVGGVGELISHETGYPLSERPNAEDYQAALMELIKDKNESRARGLRLRELLSSRHSWWNFLNTLAILPGYGCDLTTGSVDNDDVLNTPMVTVIIPCYNQGRYLRECVTSVLAACSHSLEVIIVDDGSTDSRGEYYLNEAENLAPSVVRVIRKPNGGLSSARNAALDLAQGEFIQFLDSDDMITAGKIDAQIAHMQLVPDLDVSVCNFLLCDESKTYYSKQDEAIARFNLNLEDFLYRWERGFAIPIHCGLFRRKSIKSIRFDIHAKAKEDWLFWTTLVMSGAALGYIAGHWAIYRQHEGSMRRSYMNMGRSWLQAGLKIEGMLGGRHPIFFESVVSWFEQCYRANPHYRNEVLEIKEKSKVLYNSLITKSSSDECALKKIDPIKISNQLEPLLRHEKPILISVIIPIYNHYEFIEDCILSVANQNDVFIELICIDDASLDQRVAELMRQLKDRLPNLKIIIHQENQGISKTQNDAVSIATGEYVAFLDCDDQLSPDALKIVAKEILNNQDVDYFFSDRIDIDINGFEIRTACYGGYDNIKFKSQSLICSDLLDGMVASHLKVIRRSTYTSVGGCNADYSGVQDWDLALKISEVGVLHYINIPLYRHRIHPFSVTSSDSISQFRKTNDVRRFFSKRWALSSSSQKSLECTCYFDSSSGIYSLQDLRSKVSLLNKNIFSIQSPSDVSLINILREYNSYFDEIHSIDPSVLISLNGYVWHDCKLVLSG